MAMLHHTGTMVATKKIMVSMIPSAASTAHYVRQAFFDSDRMAGTVPVWTTRADGGGDDTRQSPKASGVSAGEPATHTVTPPSFSFGEVLDIVNPLHHIPVVGNIYRRMTGDEISAVAKIAGGGLYGGAIGGVTSLVNAAMHEHTGQDTTGFIASSIRGPSAYAHTIHEDPRMAGMNSHEKRDLQTEDRVDIAMQADADKSDYRFNT